MIKNNSFPLLFLFSIAFFLLCILGTWQLNKEYNTNKNNKIINHNLTEKPKNILFINDKLPKLTYGIVNGQVIDNKMMTELKTMNQFWYIALQDWVVLAQFLPVI